MTEKLTPAEERKAVALIEARDVALRALTGCDFAELAPQIRKKLADRDAILETGMSPDAKTWRWVGLPDWRVRDLVRRSREPVADGYPPVSMSSEPGGGGTGSTLTEARALRNASPAPTEEWMDGIVRDENAYAKSDSWTERQPDFVLKALHGFYGLLPTGADALDEARTRVELVVHVETKERTREAHSTAGDCLCCTRSVDGSEDDRLRAGFCTACYRAWRRYIAAGGTDRAAFIRQRKAELDARATSETG